MKRFIKYWFLGLEENEPIDWKGFFFCLFLVLAGSMEDIIL